MSLCWCNVTVLRLDRRGPLFLRKETQVRLRLQHYSDNRLPQLLCLQVERGRRCVEEKFTLKLHPGGGIFTWDSWHRLICVLAAPIQLIDAFTKKSFCFWGPRLISSPCCLLSIFVGGQFDRPLQEVFPVNPLDYCGCNLFLFPAQSAADWLVRHLQQQNLPVIFVVK